MKYLFAAMSLFAMSVAGAQPVSFESVRLADTMLEANWKTIEQSLPLITAGVESHLRTNGMSERASKILSEEIRRSLNKENLSKAIAAAATVKLTTEEIVETTKFLLSVAGRKYLSLNSELTSQDYARPMFRQACVAALRRVEGDLEQASMNNACKGF